MNVSNEERKNYLLLTAYVPLVLDYQNERAREREKKNYNGLLYMLASIRHHDAIHMLPIFLDD